MHLERHPEVIHDDKRQENLGGFFGGMSRAFSP